MAKRLRTPIIMPRKQGGTFYTFGSAMEDIGLNINENFNRVELSHYVLLNIPNFTFRGKSSYDSETEKSDLLLDTHLNYSDSIYGERQGDYIFAESFENYCLNMETVVRNQDNYNYASNKTVSERVFWKWLFGHLKENIADHFEDAGSGYIVEKYEGTHEPIVKGFGSISAGAQRTDDSGIYNETFVQIPSSYGQMKTIFKKSVDENYKLTPYSGKTYNYIENISDDEISKSGIHYVVQFTADIDEEYTFSVGSKVKYQIPNSSNYIELTVGNITKIPTASTLLVICVTSEDATVIQDGSGILTYGSSVFHYNGASIKDESTSTTVIASTNISPYYSDDEKADYSTTPSYYVETLYDTLEVELDITKLREYYGNPSLTYDDIAMGKIATDEEELYSEKYGDYKFNAILVYYSIYNSDKTKRLATNAYGVYLLDNALYSEDDDTFYYPQLLKNKTTSDRNGSSYSFRINIKTSSAYSGDATLVDESTAAYAMSEDFNDMLRNLTAAANAMTANAKLIQKVVNDNKEIKRMTSNVMETVDDLSKTINDIKNGNTQYVSSKFVKETDGSGLLTLEKQNASNILNAFNVYYDADGRLSFNLDTSLLSNNTELKIASRLKTKFDNKDYIDCLSSMMLLLAYVKN